MTATLFNPNQENLVLIQTGWLGDGGHPLTERQMAHLSLQMPSTTLAYVNMPGVRGSNRLPMSVMREMTKTGSFEAYGELLADAFESLVNDFEKCQGAGWSKMILHRQSHGFMDAHTPYMTQLIADILKHRRSMP
ncbi:hypothetical protein EOM57_00770 [Candidatus Saccharibacteria bacterium]|nr:hypothetical protein [Candidatus Saccharibacteria bacterium]